MLQQKSDPSECFWHISPKSQFVQSRLNLHGKLSLIFLLKIKHLAQQADFFLLNKYSKVLKNYDKKLQDLAINSAYFATTFFVYDEPSILDQ